MVIRQKKGGKLSLLLRNRDNKIDESFRLLSCDQSPAFGFIHGKKKKKMRSFFFYPTLVPTFFFSSLDTVEVTHFSTARNGVNLYNEMLSCCCSPTKTMNERVATLTLHQASSPRCHGL